MSLLNMFGGNVPVSDTGGGRLYPSGGGGGKSILEERENEERIRRKRLRDENDLIEVVKIWVQSQ